MAAAAGVAGVAAASAPAAGRLVRGAATGRRRGLRRRSSTFLQVGDALLQRADARVFGGHDALVRRSQRVQPGLRDEFAVVRVLCERAVVGSCERARHETVRERERGAATGRRGARRTTSIFDLSCRSSVSRCDERLAAVQNSGSLGFFDSGTGGRHCRDKLTHVHHVHSRCRLGRLRPILPTVRHAAHGLHAVREHRPVQVRQLLHTAVLAPRLLCLVLLLCSRIRIGLRSRICCCWSRRRRRRRRWSCRWSRRYCCWRCRPRRRLRRCREQAHLICNAESSPHARRQSRLHAVHAGRLRLRSALALLRHWSLEGIIRAIGAGRAGLQHQRPEERVHR